MSLMHLTDQDFKREVLDSDAPVLVDFYADWCGPCKIMSPIIEQVSKEYNGRIKVVKLDVDNAQNTATTYGIMSIPTLILFKDGKILEQMVGVISREALKQKIGQILK